MVGFSNGGEETYNVSAIQGSLHSAAQWNLWVQNFTVAVRLSSQWPAPACLVPASVLGRHGTRSRSLASVLFPSCSAEPM